VRQHVCRRFVRAEIGNRLLLDVVRHADDDRPALLLRDIESLAHVLVHALRRMRRDVVRAGSGRERRLLDRLAVPLGVDRHLSGEDDQRDMVARRDRERGHDLREAGPARDRGDADFTGRAVIAHCHRAGAMLVPRIDRFHAGQIFHGRRPVHVAVPHQDELMVDALCLKGMGQGFVNRHILHTGGSRSERRGGAWHGV
jgi:hypothetical protein